MTSKKYQLLIAAQVERDLNEITFYLTKIGTYEKNVDSFLVHIFNDLEQLQIHPLSGVALNKKTLIPTNMRYLIIEDYLIFYEFDGQLIKVFRILSAKQDYINILKLRD